jgi:hypothetical protein
LVSFPGVEIKMGYMFLPNLLTNAVYAAFFLAVNEESLSLLSLLKGIKFYLQSILNTLANTNTAFLKHFSQF